MVSRSACSKPLPQSEVIFKSQKMKIYIWSITFVAVSLISPQLWAQEAICRELLDFERETNSKLPRSTDAATELIQVRVNCELKLVSYIMRLTIDHRELAGGWQQRKLRQHQQLHCNANGMASQLGWTARTVLYSSNHLTMLSELVTRPSDCS